MRSFATQEHQARTHHFDLKLENHGVLNSQAVPKPPLRELDGPAAGQTVPQLHLHIIPRYHGDMPDPRGGVRWIIPGKARYW